MEPNNRVHALSGASPKITRKQIAAHYGVSERTVDRWIRDPNLHFPKPKRIQRSLFFDEGEFLAWDESRSVGALAAGA